MVRLRWLVYCLGYDNWCTGHVTMVGVMVRLRWLVYCLGYDNWCTGHITMVGVLASNGRSIERKSAALPLQSS